MPLKKAMHTKQWIMPFLHKRTLDEENSALRGTSADNIIGEHHEYIHDN